MSAFVQKAFRIVNGGGPARGGFQIRREPRKPCSLSVPFTVVIETFELMRALDGRTTDMLNGVVMFATRYHM